MFESAATNKSHLFLYESKDTYWNDWLWQFHAIPLKKGAVFPTAALIAVVAIFNFILDMLNIILFFGFDD